MSQYLPTGGFRWLDLDKLPDIRSISPTAKRGSAWEVKLKYPDKLHPTHTEYPLCPERRIVKRQELGPHQNNDLIDKLSGENLWRQKNWWQRWRLKTGILSITEISSNVSNWEWNSIMFIEY